HKRLELPQGGGTYPIEQWVGVLVEEFGEFGHPGFLVLHLGGQDTEGRHTVRGNQGLSLTVEDLAAFLGLVTDGESLTFVQLRVQHAGGPDDLPTVGTPFQGHLTGVGPHGVTYTEVGVDL